MEAVVGLGQALLAGEHDLAAVVVIGFADGVEASAVIWERKGLEAVGRSVLEVGFSSVEPYCAGPCFNERTTWSKAKLDPSSKSNDSSLSIEDILVDTNQATDVC